MRSSACIRGKLICTSSSASIHSSACLTWKTDTPTDIIENSAVELKRSNTCLRAAVSSSQAALVQD